jgi:IS30 family transposase
LETKIFTAKKLQSVALEFITPDDKKRNDVLGDWNAKLFFLCRKKCWMLIHKQTKFFVILPNVTSKDLNQITIIFKKNFLEQLSVEGITQEFELVYQLIGEIKLCKSDNDRSINTHLNYTNYYIDDWKEKFKTFENIPFRELNSRLNSLPSKKLGWKSPSESMKEFIDTIKES